MVKEMLSSGKTQKEWCIESGIKYSTLRYWLRKYRYKRAEEGTAWIEVREKDKITAVLEPSGIEVHIGNYVVKVAAGFDSDVFLDVCRDLSALC
jgi:transposase-like protein